MNRIGFLTLLLAALTFTKCGKTSNEDHHDHMESADTAGQALLKEVDEIHNEAMGKMGELRKLRDDLKKQVESAADLVDDQKQLMESKIATLDSAYEGMMDWMHKFHPEVDTLAEDAYQEYLKSELEKAKKVKQDILDAIARAKE